LGIPETMSMALRYPLRNEQHWHKKMAFDKSIIPVTDINGLFIWQGYISGLTPLEVLSNLAPALHKWAICYLIKPP
jgi:hypothetical protein